MNLSQQLSQELGIELWQVQNTMQLIEGGATIPFIARYRKEQTGSLDDNVLRDLSTRLTYLQNLEKRKEDILASIEAQEKLTPELEKAVRAAKTLVEAEDLYRPYKQKRKTRASMAREKGLEPLADYLLAQQKQADPVAFAQGFVDEEKGVLSAEEALAGAQDIVAEQVSDNAELRKRLRALIWRKGLVVTKAAKKEDSVYAMYYDYNEPINKLPGHRVLAINRGEREGFLKVSMEMEAEDSLSVLVPALIKGESPCRPYLLAAISDAYSRLLFPSLDNEIRGALSETAAEQAIKVFAANLQQLLMQPPVKDRVVLGLDPAFRTGCKIAVVDGTGKVLATTVVYPTPPQNKKAEAERVLTNLIETHGVSLISIGNGTASRESEQFVAELIAKLQSKVQYVVVSEAGASVYSASKLAAEEFPEFDVSLRSAVSIARRIQDPLAELVKIDPKAIGVGQYQHDMPKNRMDESLGGVVEDCVNHVGVDLNTASHALLSYVAGVSGTVAKNIVAFREENGRFSDRKLLLKVPKLGKKTFEQCAGFLRVKESKNILDNTAVHPESYAAAKALLTLCGYSLKDVQQGNLSGLQAKARQQGMEKLSEQIGVGVPTLEDIIGELQKPGRDPRDQLPPPILRSDVLDMNDLSPNMILEGTVRNITDFGAFVDIGVHQDGLVHISQLADRFVKHPLDAVSVGDIVKVRVLEVNTQKGRIGLSMKGLPS